MPCSYYSVPGCEQPPPDLEGLTATNQDRSSRVVVFCQPSISPLVLLDETKVLWLLLECWVSFASAVGFALMGVDKSRARHHERRIREGTFYKLAAAGGAFGIVAGSSVFHHKALKDTFTGVAYAAAIGWILSMLLLRRLLGVPGG